MKLVTMFFILCFSCLSCLFVVFDHENVIEIIFVQFTGNADDGCDCQGLRPNPEIRFERFLFVGLASANGFLLRNFLSRLQRASKAGSRRQVKIH
jgi:hypothetical protein